MFDGVPPEERRSPLGGSSQFWWMIAIGMIVLSLALVVPSLGTGPDLRQEDPFTPEQRERETAPPIDDPLLTA